MHSIVKDEILTLTAPAHYDVTRKPSYRFDAITITARDGDRLVIAGDYSDGDLIGWTGAAYANNEAGEDPEWEEVEHGGDVYLRGMTIYVVEWLNAHARV